MVSKCTGIIPIIPYLVPASGIQIGAVYKRVYGFTDLRGKPAGRGSGGRGTTNQIVAGYEHVREGYCGRSPPLFCSNATA